MALINAKMGGGSAAPSVSSVNYGANIYDPTSISQSNAGKMDLVAMPGPYTNLSGSISGQSSDCYEYGVKKDGTIYTNHVTAAPYTFNIDLTDYLLYVIQPGSGSNYSVSATLS